MGRRSCKHCGDDTGTIDFATCGRCCSFKPGCWVQTPDGPSELVSERHSGSLVVEIAGIGTRLLRGSEPTIIEKPASQPAQEPPHEDTREARTPTVISVNTPTLPKSNVPTEAQETAAALTRLEHEAKTRLERIWLAHRLSLAERSFPPGSGRAARHP
jgi:hypothetical protein